MSLIHDAREIEPDVVALECHVPACGKRHTGGDLEMLRMLAGELLCLDCNTGGLIPRRRSKVDEKFPDELAGAFLACKLEFFEFASHIGLSRSEERVLIRLEYHRWHAGDIVFPDRDKLAAFAGVSVDQVTRITTKLQKRGLLKKWQPGATKEDGGRAATRYDLAPLWEKVAKWKHTGRVACAPGAQTSRDEDLSAPQSVDNPPEMGLACAFEPDLPALSERVACAPGAQTNRSEVDAFEEEPKGASSSESNVAAASSSSTEDDHDDDEGATVVTKLSGRWRRKLLTIQGQHALAEALIVHVSEIADMPLEALLGFTEKAA